MSALIKKLSLLNFQWELLTGLYMLQPWEKLCFNSVVLIVIFGSIRVGLDFWSQLLSSAPTNATLAL